MNPNSRSGGLPSGRPPDLTNGYGALDLGSEKEKQQVQGICSGPFLERPGSPLATEVEDGSRILDESTESGGGGAISSMNGGYQILKPGQEGGPVTYAGIVGGLSQGNNRDRDGLEDLTCDPNSVEESCVGKDGRNDSAKEDPIAPERAKGVTEGMNRFAMLESEQVEILGEQVSDFGDGSDKGNGRGAGKVVVLPMVKGQQVSVVEHSSLGGSKEHTAVSLFEKGHGNVRLDGVVHGKMHGGRRGVRDSVQQGLKVRKPPDMRTISRPVLNEWVDTMNLQIKAITTQAGDDPGGSAQAVVNQDGVLEPVARTLGARGVRAADTTAESGVVEGSLVADQ
ncbi:hypothetical protein V6N11_039082 [Hibiscus sabdariffa]|uniref:Uncharacterized protein n=1 Tax=Hibiscus sabdariffa TaxID=183260 RepID=A0ABR2SM65_9ROSI